MNINPQVWGRDTWNFLYYVALSYPKNPTHEDKIKFEQFYTLIGKIIPCENCQNNFSKHIKLIPLQEYLDSSYDLFSWVCKMDNKVRILNGKSQKSVEDSFQYYINKIKINEKFGFNLSGKEKVLIGMGIVILFLFLIKKIKI